MPTSSEGKRFVEFGCTNQRCHSQAGRTYILRWDGTVPDCQSCGTPQTLIQDWRPASEVERLRSALERIADENDPLEGIGSEQAFARAALADDEKDAT